MPNFAFWNVLFTSGNLSSYQEAVGQPAVRYRLFIAIASDPCLSQGYLSFWNDNISYALRGCILIELALRRRIALVKDPSRRRNPLSERLVEVIDDRQTGETILDETLRMMKSQQDVEKINVNSWIDLLSGKCD